LFVVELVFLKLGGSLITDKDNPYTARREKLADLVREIATVVDKPDARIAHEDAASGASGVRLILGHGSGSFGHTAAKIYHTRGGISPRPPDRQIPYMDYWTGFAEVRYRAAQLNGLIMEMLHQAGLPALVFPPSATIVSRDHQIKAWDTAPIRKALDYGLLPVVYGDVVFDETQGGTILSTEDLFAHLARVLRPDRILLAGLEEGVWEDFPARTIFVREITPHMNRPGRWAAKPSQSVDVTGGMRSKVGQMLELVQEMPGLTAQIFSGESANALARALEGEVLGTLIKSE